MTRSIDRRRFLVAGLTAGLTTGLTALLAAARAVERSVCASTEDNPEGPFYLPGAPFRSQLAPAREPGDRLRIAGRVLGGPDCEPLAGAVVDVWHASSDGFYAGLEAPKPLKPEDYHFRGRIRTAQDGSYAFDTVVPGAYRVDRERMRPRHIHYTVSHPSCRSLTTQLYFAEDPLHAGDPMVKPSLIIPLLRQGGTGATAAFEGTFDIVLIAT